MPKANPKNKAAPARRSAEVEHESVTPKIGRKGEKTKTPPRLEESPPFLFTHHPEAFLVMGGKVVPRLGKFKLLGGVNGVDANSKTGEVIAEDALNELKSKGYEVIPADVDGEGTSYVRRPKAAPHVHISKWEKVYHGSSKIDCDVKGYTEWCASLVERGVLPPPPVYILERLEADLRRQLEELEDKRGVESLRKRIAGDLAAVEAELEIRREAEGSELVDDLEPVDPEVKA